MDMTPVVSSHLAAVGWEDGVLHVEFTSGAVYAYRDVPKAVYTALTQAVSPGRAFARLVRGNFIETQVD